MDLCRIGTSKKKLNCLTLPVTRQWAMWTVLPVRDRLSEKWNAKKSNQNKPKRNQKKKKM